MEELHDLKRIANYQGLTIVEDPKLTGEKVAEMYEGDTEVRVSPAMFILIKSNFDVMADRLKIRKLPPKK